MRENAAVKVSARDGRAMLAGAELETGSSEKLGRIVEGDYGRYWISQTLLGKGTYGAVWYGERLADQLRVAVKMLPVQTLGESEKEVAAARARAVNEAAVMRSIRHANVVGLLDVVYTKEYLMLVMEHCDGGDLSKLIKASKGRLWPEERVVNVFSQVACGLAALHAHHVLHRDLKPANIMMTSSGTVKLGDLGIATVLTSTESFAQTVIGTPYYMSPELCEEKPYNAASDCWSLGCLLYEMLTLKRPFKASSLPGLILQIMRGSYTEPHMRYSSGLRRLVASLLCLNPQGRPTALVTLNTLKSLGKRGVKTVRSAARVKECGSPTSRTAASPNKVTEKSERLEINEPSPDNESFAMRVLKRVDDLRSALHNPSSNDSPSSHSGSPASVSSAAGGPSIITDVSSHADGQSAGKESHLERRRSLVHRRKGRKLSLVPPRVNRAVVPFCGGSVARDEEGKRGPTKVSEKISVKKKYTQWQVPSAGSSEVSWSLVLPDGSSVVVGETGTSKDRDALNVAEGAESTTRREQNALSCSRGGGIAGRVETLRQSLEQRMGFELFMQVYSAVRGGAQDEEVHSMVGVRDPRLLRDLNELLRHESEFYEADTNSEV